MRVRFVSVGEICLILCIMTSSGQAAEAPETYSVGVAQVDITPDYPVRLSGFGFRRTESEGVTQPIWAKALAIASDATASPVVVVTVDNLGIPASMRDEVARRLSTKTNFDGSRLAIAASHTHTGPMLRGVAPTLFSGPISDEHWKQIDRYTAELTDKLEAVALAALNDRQPARLTWGIGSVKFAINRRTKGGPVDHDLPILVVRSVEGKLRAIHVNYACHCVTLSNNKISGDWAGYAQDLIQREFPSAIALIAIGCGADQNPSSGVTGDKVNTALQQGTEIAAEVKRLLGGFLTPVHGEITTASKVVMLDFAEPWSKEQWEERARRNDAAGYHARVQLDRLARGEALQTSLSYPITSWSFGKSLAMVFLPGEVVVDYSLRLKRELDGGRLWLNAYANDAPCYIPSERVLAEGGYEALDAMYYYDRPSALKPGLETKIIGAVHEQLDAKFVSPFDANKTAGTMPKSPQQSLATMQTTPNLRVDLVVAEPLIADPVAIDFAMDGGLFVAEMNDYPEGRQTSTAETLPSGVGRQTGPSGRIRLVRDTDGDGQFDRSTIFLDDITLPTGVTVWRNGILICSAPDILFAEDTDGDDKADVVKKLYSGFGTSNNQARLNSLTFGLDGWIYGSCGLFGGKITSFNGTECELGDRDFRIKPDTGEIEAATGRTQQGRVRDNFGNWFGCDNSTLGFHYPLAEHDLKRNPFVASPASRVNLVQTDDARQLFPARTDAQRFQLSGPPGTVTAACGLGVYLDSQLGPDYTGNLFVCEPVNLLVHRMALKPHGSSFIAERPANEARTEFLRSTDGWFRPVQAITGPDGGMWIVDMYRFIIEDPRWIPEEERAPLDLRAGSTLGRIYRVMKAEDRTPPAVRFALTIRDPSPVNKRTKKGAVYDEKEIQQLETKSKVVDYREARQMTKSWRVAMTNAEPNLRMISYRKLAAQGSLSARDIRTVLADPDDRLRAFGVKLAQRSPEKDALIEEVMRLTMDTEPHVRLQAASSLGEWNDPQVGTALAKMALRDADDPYLVAAVFSSVIPQNLQLFTTTLFAELSGKEVPPTLMAPFLATAVGYADDAAIRLALVAVVPKPGDRPQAWQLNAVTRLVESLSQRPKSQVTEAGVQSVVHRMQEDAQSMAVAETLDDESRLAAINLLGREPGQYATDVKTLTQLLAPSHAPSVQLATIEALERIGSDEVPTILSSHFQELSPALQSRIVDALLNRDAWLGSLFEAFQQRTIPTSSISAAQRQELVDHPNPTVSKRSKELFAIAVNANRQQVIQQYRPALGLAADAERGRTVFAKSCSVCHKIGETGHAVGPNLAMVANKSPSFLLQEILDPNRNVDSRYASYVAVTKSGITRTGILSSESSVSLTLLATEGKEFTILRKEIDELRANGKSLMPEGMEKDLSQQAVADLIAFLTSMPAPSKQVTGNSPEMVKSNKGQIALLASNAAIYGEQITFEQPFGNIGYWHGLNDHVVWSTELTDAGEFDVYLDGACDAGSAGNKYRLEFGDLSLSGQIESTGGWNKYTSTKLGTVRLNAGQHRIVFRPDGTALRGALVDLRGLHMMPRGEPFALMSQKPESEIFEIRELARKILDEALTETDRETIIAKNVSHAAALTTEMTREMPDDTKEEYRRIPWIWRVAIACGKRGQSGEIVKLLEVSLPQSDQPLKDWQAVVVGGGIINGIGLVGNWPKSRLEKLLRDRPELKQRWTRTLVLASEMADNEKILAGTRYDALRIIALDDWPRRREQLTKYLGKSVDEELQMGAISGLSDVESNDIAQLLLASSPDFYESNQKLAIEALLRSTDRSEELLDAIDNGKISARLLDKSHRKVLRESKNDAIRNRALKIFGE